MKKQYEVLQWAFSFLKKHDCEENVANILLQHHLKVSQEKLMLMMREELPEKVIIQFKEDIKQHALTGIPVQHLMGYTYFYGRKFTINENVLIPRFDTEILVQHTIDTIRTTFNENEKITIVDVGTGSGIIAITLALELPNAIIYATDISEAALEIAQTNAANYNANVQFLNGDFLEPIILKKVNPEVVVSNPPYIKELDRKTLSNTVKNFDPLIALFGGEDGLSAYKEILSQIKLLKQSEYRIVCFEIGFDQAEDIVNLINHYFPNSLIQVLQDLNEKDRVISIKNLK